MRKHGVESFFVVGEGVLEFDRNGQPRARQPLTDEELRRFRFSRLGPEGPQFDEATRTALARAITADGAQLDSDPPIPAGFTYLGQFVDHDLTMDRTATQLGEDVNLGDLVQGRSPALDLDSVYGRGPQDPNDRVFYADDGVTLKIGTTSATNFPDERVNVELEGFDLPRAGGSGGTIGDRRLPLIPDSRNDENLAVAQTHLAFIRFHNRVVDSLPNALPATQKFAQARDIVTRHYQWMLRTDYLPRIVAPAVVNDVFNNGRKAFEPNANPTNVPTMPIEFSVAAFRLGHAMIRQAYNWNAAFPGQTGTLDFLFTFSGTSGDFFGGVRLPSNWIADWRRMYDFKGEVNRPDLASVGGLNKAMRIDTTLARFLHTLPTGSTGDATGGIHDDLAFRNLRRARMVKLATGQQMARFLKTKGVTLTALTRTQVRDGKNGAELDALTQPQRKALLDNTPLWFYVLREAELNNGKLKGVGGRIVAETFHRAMEGSTSSIVRDPTWRPTLGPNNTTFRMTDLLMFAFEGKKNLLAPLGDQL